MNLSYHLLRYIPILTQNRIHCPHIHLNTAALLTQKRSIGAALSMSNPRSPSRSITLWCLEALKAHPHLPRTVIDKLDT
jgi:hypothetical protein